MTLTSVQHCLCLRLHGLPRVGIHFEPDDARRRLQSPAGADIATAVKILRSRSRLGTSGVLLMKVGFTPVGVVGEASGVLTADMVVQIVGQAAFATHLASGRATVGHPHHCACSTEDSADSAVRCLVSCSMLCALRRLSDTGICLAGRENRGLQSCS